MTESITRCPKCKTSFRVNEEHLKTARGAVRCGSCLNIFNASEHIFRSSQTKTADHNTELADKRSELTTADDDEILISDDMHLDDDASLDGEAAEDELESNIFIANPASKTEINLFERRIKDAEENDRDNIEADESWALNLLEEDKQEEQANTPSFSFTPSESRNTEKPGGSKSAAGQQQDTAEEKFSSVFQVLEDENTDGISARSEPSLDEQIGESNENEYSDENDYDENHFDEHGYDQDKDPDSYYDNEDTVAPGPYNTDFFESFEPEPLELQVKKGNPIWHSRPFWFAVNSLALLALVAQVTYFKFDDWGRQQHYRPYYAQLCGIIGCSLPVLQDLNQVRIDNMVVIDHPQKTQMLLVDATIQNRAKFDQYFPTLMLTFTDINNTLVKQLIFTPSEYVGGELAGKDLMPAKHPIHITLEIQDPGEDALNYQISIVKP